MREAEDNEAVAEAAPAAEHTAHAPAWVYERLEHERHDETDADRDRESADRWEPPHAD